MRSTSYQVPDFETLKQYAGHHYEHVFTPTKLISGNQYLAEPAPIPENIPLEIVQAFESRHVGVIASGENVKLELGKPVICLFKLLPLKEGANKRWVAIESALPANDFAVSSIIGKTLESWRFKFVEKKMKELYSEFGEFSMMVLSHNPDAAQKILQLSDMQMLRLNNEWENIRKYWHEMRVLLRFGIDVRNTHMIIDAYRGGESSGMNRHPYRIVQKMQLESSVQDKFFRAMGVLDAAAENLEANMRDYLDARVERDGATAISLETAAYETSVSLKVKMEKVETTLHDMILHNRADYRLIGNMSSISLGKSVRNDLSVGANLALRIVPMPNAPDYKNYRGDIKQDGTYIELNQEQKTAIYLALSNKTSIITGGPGTGKTTTAKTLIREIRSITPRGRVILAAPTGKAARRMAEVTGLPCMTMHRMLGMAPGTSSMLTSFGENDTLIIDEMSMVDQHLFANAVRHIGSRGRLVILGDADQLASVDSGDVLLDLILSRRVPVARLTDVQRQAALSNIVTGAYNILKGEMPKFEKDLHFIKASSSMEITERVKELVSKIIPNEYGINHENIQILGAMRKGDAGINALNRELKGIFNPSSRTNLGVYRQLGSNYYHVGDRVMYLRNRYDRDIQNGECGNIVDFDEPAQELVLDVEGRMVRVPYANYQDITYAWASTVHKSQGSEYPCVIFVLPKEHIRMLTRNLMFTALTRGKFHVFFVGEEDVLEKALKNNFVPKRRTHLSFMVAEAHDKSNRSNLFRKMISAAPRKLPRRRREIKVEDIEVPF